MRPSWLTDMLDPFLGTPERCEIRHARAALMEDMNLDEGLTVSQ
jgi:hypothetical protein